MQSIKKGPATVRMFLDGTAMPDGMTPEQVRQDAFQQVRALPQRLGIEPLVPGHLATSGITLAVPDAPKRAGKQGVMVQIISVAQ